MFTVLPCNFFSLMKERRSKINMQHKQKSKILIFSILSFLVLPALGGEGGGSSTVGDGGFALVCKAGLRGRQVRAELLDLYEAQILSGQRNTTTKTALGSNRESPQRLLSVALERLFLKIHVTPEEALRVKSAGQALLKKTMDPWAGGVGLNINQHIVARDIDIDARVYNAAKADGCEITAVVIRPSRDLEERRRWTRYCAYRGLDFENCFFMDKKIFRDLSSGHKACLAVHESLRYLPELLRPVDDADLRRTVAEICFQ